MRFSRFGSKYSTGNRTSLFSTIAIGAFHYFFMLCNVAYIFLVIFVFNFVCVRSVFVGFLWVAGISRLRCRCCDRRICEMSDRKHSGACFEQINHIASYFKKSLVDGGDSILRISLLFYFNRTTSLSLSVRFTLKAAVSRLVNYNASRDVVNRSATR